MHLHNMHLLAARLSKPNTNASKTAETHYREFERALEVTAYTAGFTSVIITPRAVHLPSR